MAKLRVVFLIFLFGFLFFAVHAKAGNFLQNQTRKLQDSAVSLSVQKPEIAWESARRVLLIPDATFSNGQKVEFFRKLAADFQDSGHYKEAYYCLKTADSLSKIRVQTESLPTLNTGKGWLGTLFYVFLSGFALFIFFVYYSLHTKKIQWQKLKSEHEQLVREEKNLQADLEKKIKEENRDLLQKLDDIKQEELEIKSSLQKLEKTSYLRNAFIANLGFDVRTSLNGIIGFANMLETELAVQENRDLYIFASSIAKSGSRLLRLLNNVIDLSAIEARSMEVNNASYALAPVIKRVYQKFVDQAKDKNLIFKIKLEEGLPSVFADEKALEKVLDQITDNAIRYTDLGFVTLSAYHLPEKETNVIEVKDNGPGMDRKVKQLIMSGVDPEATELVNYGIGTGIGLKLARKLMLLMRGKMEIITNRGEGTIVQIYLPCSERVATVASVETTPVRETDVVEFSEKLDLFVLEDDRMNRLILEKMLRKLGDVELAVDGADCLKKVAESVSSKHYYQAMIFDINLPDEWDGVQLMKEIRRKYPQYRRIPFIAQTAYAMEGDKERFLAEGFDSYLSKPIDRNELFAVIQQQLDIYSIKKK
ncbi:MAG: response regulator [Bacteroidales bacterium]|nr:response regulator [Bacteroidales bacterium]